MNELIAANILIGDRSYRVKIEPKDEEAVRGTVKTINDKLLEFKTQFAGKDMQDYIAMVIIWYATQGGHHMQDAEQAALGDQLAKMEAQLDGLLES